MLPAGGGAGGGEGPRWCAARGGGRGVVYLGEISVSRRGRGAEAHCPRHCGKTESAAAAVDLVGEGLHRGTWRDMPAKRSTLVPGR